MQEMWGEEYDVMQEMWGEEYDVMQEMRYISHYYTMQLRQRTIRNYLHLIILLC